MLNESRVHESTVLEIVLRILNALLLCFNHCHENELMRFDAILMTII